MLLWNFHHLKSPQLLSREKLRGFGRIPALSRGHSERLTPGRSSLDAGPRRRQEREGGGRLGAGGGRRREGLGKRKACGSPGGKEEAGGRQPGGRRKEAGTRRRKQAEASSPRTSSARREPAEEGEEGRAEGDRGGGGRRQEEAEEEADRAAAAPGHHQEVAKCRAPLTAAKFAELRDASSRPWALVKPLSGLARIGGLKPPAASRLEVQAAAPCQPCTCRAQRTSLGDTFLAFDVVIG